MVNVSAPHRAVLVRASLCCARHFTLTVSIFTQAYKKIPAYAGGNQTEKSLLTCRYAIANQQVIRDAEESRSGQFRQITCEIATSDPRVLSLCCQGVGHAFNFGQSQVRSHEGLTCVRVCGFCKLGVFDKVDRVLAEYSLVRACFRLAPLFFFSASRVFIGPYVFLSRSIVSSASFSWVFISPSVFSTRSIVSSASSSTYQSVYIVDKLHCAPRIVHVFSAECVVFWLSIKLHHLSCWVIVTNKKHVQTFSSCSYGNIPLGKDTNVLLLLL